jgi:hypothetical protein
MTLARGRLLPDDSQPREKSDHGTCVSPWSDFPETDFFALADGLCFIASQRMSGGPHGADREFPRIRLVSPPLRRMAPNFQARSSCPSTVWRCQTRGMCGRPTRIEGFRVGCLSRNRRVRLDPRPAFDSS